jgi:hypothetical protein
MQAQCGEWKKKHIKVKTLRFKSAQQSDAQTTFNLLWRYASKIREGEGRRLEGSRRGKNWADKQKIGKF